MLFRASESCNRLTVRKGNAEVKSGVSNSYSLEKEGLQPCLSPGSLGINPRFPPNPCMCKLSLPAWCVGLPTCASTHSMQVQALSPRMCESLPTCAGILVGPGPLSRDQPLSCTDLYVVHLCYFS